VSPRRLPARVVRLRHPLLSLLVIAAMLAIVANGACGEDPADTEAPTDAGAVEEDLGNNLEDADVEDVAADDVPVDVGADDTPAFPPDDVPVEDVGYIVNCPGGEGCACEDNDECDNAFCIVTPDGRKCAVPCVETCDKGWTCTQLGAKDSLFICVPDYVTLCAPCQKSADCEVQGVKSLCLDYGADGRFCGGPCKVDDDCPQGYGCEDATDGEGGASKQCRLKEGATCACSWWASDSGAKMSCDVTNEHGKCPGTRTCGKAGLGPCTGTEPAAEVCDDLDNDCDGKTDVLPASATCSVKTFTGQGSKAVCKADADCTVEGEACDEAAGLCKTLIGECSGTPICTAQGDLECIKAKQAKFELCNGEDDDCDGQTDEDFAWSNPLTGAPAIVGQPCGLGPCGGGTVKCDTLSKAVCDGDAKSKAETCNGVDDDCDGKTDEKTCSDDNACTDDVCDGAAGKCSNPVAQSCDDANQCTTDSCDMKTGTCVFKPHVGACDDGNACTTGDVCGLAGGVTPTCMAGAIPADCDDKNPCTDDSCKADSGCAALPNAITLACYDGAAKTEDVGPCHGGHQVCAGGKLQPICVGQVIPAKTEACDGIDDDCDGTTDEGCAAASADVTFSAAFATSVNDKHKLTWELGGTSPTGAAKGDKHSVRLGFVQWLMALWK